MTGHETFVEELTRYLLNELPAEERRSVEQHLGTCGECRTELEKLRSAEALLVLSGEEAAPPPRARARLMSAIAREPRLAVVPQASRPRAWWMWIPSVAALALAIAVGVLWQENSDLREKANRLAAIEAQQDLGTQNAKETKEIIADMTAKGAIHVTLHQAGTDPQPHAQAAYNPKDGGIVLIASNLTQLPAGEAYQLWIVPMDHGKPIRAATFKPTSRGTAVVMNHNKMKTAPQMFAVTIEPEDGMNSTALPTYPAVLASPIGE
jgi:anti-sigma-K factor RskA